MKIGDRISLTLEQVLNVECPVCKNREIDITGKNLCGFNCDVFSIHALDSSYPVTVTGLCIKDTNIEVSNKKCDCTSNQLLWGGCICGGI